MRKFDYLVPYGICDITYLTNRLIQICKMFIRADLDYGVIITPFSKVFDLTIPCQRQWRKSKISNIRLPLPLMAVGVMF